MSYQSPYKEFIFEQATFDEESGVMTLRYSFDGVVAFAETIQFEVPAANYDRSTLDRAMLLAFIVAGISYYKCHPTSQVRLRQGALTPAQAAFFSEVYRDGLSQFVYENGLQPDDIATFTATSVDDPVGINDYVGEGTLVLQSGGKDSLLVATLLERNESPYSAWYLSHNRTYPMVIDSLRATLRLPIRRLDLEQLRAQAGAGGLNGHVPVTFINLSFALIDAILHSESTVVAAIGREGEEPHAYIGDYAVRHQWSKTWHAEQLFSDYVRSFVASNLSVGSPLRSLSELKIAQLFAEHAWDRFGHSFSSCNTANYQQSHDNSQLTWCGECPKCANSFLLFAPFIARTELELVFGSNLFNKPILENTFKGLLGIDGVEKPFECVGEIEELRAAYHLALKNGYDELLFEVPVSDYNMEVRGDSQSWALEMLQY